MRMRDIGNGGNVQNQHAGIAQTFGVDGAGVGLNGSGKSFGLAGINKGGLDAKLGQVDGQQSHRAAIQSAGGNHMIARLQNGHEGHGLCGHARCRGNTCSAAF